MSWEPRPNGTVVHRVVDGEHQYVFVCEGCEEIRVLTAKEAMQTALNLFIGQHKEERHK